MFVAFPMVLLGSPVNDAWARAAFTHTWEIPGLPTLHTAHLMKEGKTMDERILAVAREAIHAELEADTAAYRDDNPDGE